MQNRGSSIRQSRFARDESGEFDHYEEVPGNIAQLIIEGKK
ncbi:MAG: hypothetical protein WAP51_03925 [Candidatus Sungiibacteriota bacterium]